MAVYHAIERTSPKGVGSPFVGRCMLCGTPDLPAKAALEICANPLGLTQDEVMIKAISGNNVIVGDGT